MYAVIFFVYGVGLYYGGQLIIDSNKAHPDCYDHPSRSYCFSGGDAMLVRIVWGAGNTSPVRPHDRSHCLSASCQPRVLLDMFL